MVLFIRERDCVKKTKQCKNKKTARKVKETVRGSRKENTRNETYIREPNFPRTRMVRESIVTLTPHACLPACLPAFAA